MIGMFEQLFTRIYGQESTDKWIRVLESETHN